MNIKLCKKAVINKKAVMLRYDSLVFELKESSVSVILRWEGKEISRIDSPYKIEVGDRVILTELSGRTEVFLSSGSTVKEKDDESL